MRKNLKVVNVVLLFYYYLLNGKGVKLQLNKLESPSIKDALSHGWLKCTQRFLRRWKGKKENYNNKDILNNNDR